MVSITCDGCGDVKPESKTGPEWILGYDLQVEAPNAVQRSIRFLDRWDDRRVLELGAIHFCSYECRDKYVAKTRAA